MKPKIRLLKVSQYGRTRMFPDCPLSKAICAVSNKKILSETDVTILDGIGGCEIEIDDTAPRPTKKRKK